MSWMTRLRSTFQREKLEKELEEEVRSHLEMRAQAHRQSGMTPEEARRQAMRDFGNSTLIKEDTREASLIRWLEILFQNLRYSGRLLRRNMGFTAVVMLTLAIGIGANIATFSVVHAVLLRPLPFPHPEQLVRVYDDLRGSNNRDVGMSVPEFWDLRDISGVFQDFSVLAPINVNLEGDEKTDRVEGLVTSPNYFTMLGAQPQLGRIYTVADAQPGFSDPVVLSDGFWHRMFGASPSVLGKRVRLDTDLYTIVGVMPAAFHHPGPALDTGVDIWLTAGFNGPPLPLPPQRSVRFLPGAIARLKTGLAVAQAQAQLDTFVKHESAQFPNEYPAAADWGVRLAPIQEDLVGPVRRELVVLFAAVGFVLLITCVNLANLLLARSAAREREMAVRVALGAGPRRLLGQMVTESLLLAVLSGGLAVFVVFLLKGALVKLAPADLPRIQEVSLSPAVLLFAFGLSLATGLLFGLMPAWQSVKSSQIESLREGGRGSGLSRRQTRMSKLLVASEIALSLVLLIGAGLLLRSFQHLLEVHPGFEPSQLVTAKVWLPVPNDPKNDVYPTVEKRGAFLKEVLRRVQTLPGVEEAAIGALNSVPMGGNNFPVAFSIENRVAESERRPVADLSTISPEYFQVLRIRLIRGRAFTESDEAKGQPVAIINEAMARLFWGDSDPVGQRIRTQLMGSDNPWTTIVGVVGDVRSQGIELEAAPRIFRPVYQDTDYGAVVFARTRTEPGTLGDAVRREVQTVDPTIPVFEVRAMNEIVSQSLADRRFALELLAVFAGVALLLACVGVYGVMAYIFSRRKNEIGIRMALGADRADIFRMALGEGAAVIGIGLAAGLIGSAILTQSLASMLFGVKPTDPATFASIAALLAGAALLACWIPALRTTRGDPLTALRHE